MFEMIEDEYEYRNQMMEENNHWLFLIKPLISIL
jgi:hypothetical protein